MKPDNHWRTLPVLYHHPPPPDHVVCWLLFQSFLFPLWLLCSVHSAKSSLRLQQTRDTRRLTVLPTTRLGKERERERENPFSFNEPACLLLLILLLLLLFPFFLLLPVFPGVSFSLVSECSLHREEKTSIDRRQSRARKDPSQPCLSVQKIPTPKRCTKTVNIYLKDIWPILAPRRF